MALPDFSENKPERPFEGMKIYFSGPIVVAEGGDLNFSWDLVQFMKEKGAKVLSEHVGGRSAEERTELFKKNTEGHDQSDNSFVRHMDLHWVDESDVMIAVINKPSFGIGMEIQRAVDKPRLGLNITPVLCLLSDEITARQSKMITGITDLENPGFKLARYKTVEEAESLIFDFLQRNK